MTLLHYKSACHQFMVNCLEHDLFRIIMLGENDTGVSPATYIPLGLHLVINLVKGHPVSDLVLVPFHHGNGIPHKKIHHLTINPAAVHLSKMVWHLKMAKGNDWLDTILQQFIEQIIIETQAGLIRLFLIAIRENTTPGN